MTKKITTNITTVFLLTFSFFLSFAFTSAQSYYNGYNNYDYYNYNNYNNPYNGVTTFNGSVNSNYGYNNYGYNNYSYVPNVSVTPCYTNCGTNYNYNNNYNNYNNNCYNYNCQNNYNYYTLYPVTSAATYVTTNSATINGSVTVSNTNTNNYNNYGTTWFQYGTSYSNLNMSTNPAQVTGSTNTNAYLTGLSCGTTYYFRAVTNSNNGTQYGTTLSFATTNCYSGYYQNSYPSVYQNFNYGYGNINTNCTPYKAVKKYKRYY